MATSVAMARVSRSLKYPRHAGSSSSVTHFQTQHRRDRIRRVRRQAYAHIPLILRYRERRLPRIGQHVGLSHRSLHASQIKFATIRPFEDFDVELSRLSRAAPDPFRVPYRLAVLVFLDGIETAGFFTERGWVAPVDRFAVDFQPFADGKQPIHFGLGDYAFGGR